MPPDLLHERLLAREAGGWPLGIDEVGRGPLAGPVLAAAVRLHPDRVPPGLADSKTLSPDRRRALDRAVREAALAVGIGLASAAEVDALNVHHATLLAMRRAAAAAGGGPVLVDGRFVPPGLVGRALVRGDALSASVAAASVVAKVARDTIMAALSQHHPFYGWERNAGYGTAEHRAALLQHGVTPHHRRTFGTVHKMLCP